MRRRWSYGKCGSFLVAAVLCALWAGGTARAAEQSAAAPQSLRMSDVKAYSVPYVAWNGQERECIVLLPVRYRLGSAERLPCIINPHARGSGPWPSAKLWGDLPSTARVAIICAGSAGRVDADSSWSYPRQIADLMDLPYVVRKSLPGLHLDDSRLYAVGVSMGGMEALSLLARYPDRLAGVASFDGVADLAAYYYSLPWTVRARQQARLRREVGGSPRGAAFRYSLRSPLTFSATLATCQVPIGVWWSSRDRSVRFQESRQSGKLCRRIRSLLAGAPLYEVTTNYAHGFVLHDDPGRVLELLRPNGYWVARSSTPPAKWSYASWLPDVTVWGCRFLMDAGSNSMWRVTMGPDQISAQASAPLTVQLPWTGRRSVTVAVDDRFTTVRPENGVLEIELPKGRHTALIYR